MTVPRCGAVTLDETTNQETRCILRFGHDMGAAPVPHDNGGIQWSTPTGNRLYPLDAPRVGDWILTHAGVEFYPFDSRPSEIVIEDIAHALANTCRFTGHVKSFYSVAQHSVLVSCVVPPEHALWGLLHDASEAYLADVARPVKMHPTMDGYREAEKRIMAAVCERFDLPLVEPACVKDADTRMMVTEARDLMPPNAVWASYGVDPYENIHVSSWHPATARDIFLARFESLTTGVDDAVVRERVARLSAAGLAGMVGP